jgi:hypothetical protein
MDTENQITSHQKKGFLNPKEALIFSFPVQKFLNEGEDLHSKSSGEGLFEKSPSPRNFI